MDKVEARLMTIDGEYGPFKVLCIDIPNDYHAAMDVGKYVTHIALYSPTDDDLRAIQFACGEEK
jgi:hypothetical protein